MARHENMSWIGRLFTKEKEAPLRGARPVRREKTYSADTGYVYQYFYEGYREAKQADESGTEHVFSVTSDRVSRFPINIFVPGHVVEAWQSSNDRELTATEQYAVVKMTLFEVFDERTDFDGSPWNINISLENIEEHAETLDL